MINLVLIDLVFINLVFINLVFINLVFINHGLMSINSGFMSINPDLGTSVHVVLPSLVFIRSYTQLIKLDSDSLSIRRLLMSGWNAIPPSPAIDSSRWLLALEHLVPVE
ncbi:hypothetical protein BKA62DRAFT_776381 [Auriculariales sp. MPI-PUGE-AT-0066]|nr:hypothetical protein BKA62DRAFT_776381 [Auriculariales sp. MPI-PUGE-AT-0066]